MCNSLSKNKKGPAVVGHEHTLVSFSSFAVYEFGRKGVKQTDLRPFIGCDLSSVLR